MAEGDAGFTGSIPQLYDRCLGPLLFEPYGTEMAARVESTAGDVLEIAAGTGIATAAMASRFPSTVRLIATDLNRPMLDHAAGKPGMDRVSWRQADALALPFEAASFDLVVCQFGIMFFSDRPAGLREMHRVLRPGGRLLFTVWDRIASNPIMQAAIDGLARRYPNHPSWFLDRTPCGYRNPDQIRADVTDAGFHDCVIDVNNQSGLATSPEETATGLCQGTPMRAEIEALDPGGLPAATAAAAAEIARRFGEGSFAVPLQALFVTARR